MRFLSVAILTSCLLACGHAQAPQKPAVKADHVDCENVYQYIISITIDQLDEEHHFTKVQRDGASWELEQEWERTGTKDRFMASCMKDMTKAQVDCATHVNHVEEIHNCVTLIR